MSYTVEEFKTALNSDDADSIIHAFVSLKGTDVQDYLTPDAYKSFIGDQLSKRNILLETAYSVKYHLGQSIPDKDTRNSYGKAFAEGVRQYYETLLRTKDFQALTHFLIHFADGTDEGQKIAQSVFTKEDIKDLSAAFLKLEKDDEADYNFFHYGLFCEAMSKGTDGKDPFKNLRKAIPQSDLLEYRQIYAFDGCAHLVHLLASGSHFNALIQEEEAIAAIHAHLDGPHNASTMQRMQDHPAFKKMFEKNMPVILDDMIGKIHERNTAYQINKTLHMMDSNGVAHIISPAQAKTILSAFAGLTGREIMFSETLKIFAKRNDFMEIVPQGQISAVTRRLVDFPPREDHMDQRGHLEYEYRKMIDERVTAFSTIANVAAKHHLLDNLVADDFEKAAAAMYRDGNNMNSCWDIGNASDLRRDFREAWAKGLISVETPRQPYDRITGYEPASDTLILAAK